VQLGVPGLRTRTPPRVISVEALAARLHSARRLPEGARATCSPLFDVASLLSEATRDAAHRHTKRCMTVFPAGWARTGRLWEGVVATEEGLKGLRADSEW
jgi:hypothetical protein